MLLGTTPAMGQERAAPSSVNQSTKQAPASPEWQGSGTHSPSTLGNAWRSEQNLRHTATPTGGVGLLRVSGSDLGGRGLLRLAVTGEFFSSADFPVQGAANTRTAGTFALSYVPLDFLEVSLAYTASANTNTRSTPQLIQALGDVVLGAKATKQWMPGLWAGVDVRLLSFSGVGSQDSSGPAFGFMPQAVATYDVRALVPQVPLRAHANLGLKVDGTGSLVDTERLNASEEYALGINRYPRLAMGLAVEAPLPVATPFIEYGLALPLGVEGGTLVAPDGQLEPVGSVAPQTLALGAKVTALPNLTFTAAAELGLTRMVGQGVSPTPPFNLFLGASFNVDPLQGGGPRRVDADSPRELRAEIASAGKAQVSGVVVDAKTRLPVPGVLVAMVDSSLPPVASDLRSGRFLTYSLPSGPVKLLAFKEGYRPLEHQMVLKVGETATVELALEQDAKPGTLALAITARKRPVGATLTFHGPEQKQVTLSQAEAASHQLQLKAGSYRVEATAPGYLSRQRVVQVADGAALALAFELEPEPKQKQVKVDGDKLELLQALRFSDGKAELLADSQPLLAQVVDAIIRGGFKRLRIESHTDNRGNSEDNLKLSKERARAVKEYLIQAGLEPERLESEGYGDTRPIAPNLTPRGRELNRRVDFVILER